MDERRNWAAARSFLTPEEAALYHSNVWFRTGVDAFFEGTAPMYLKGLAADAREQNERMEQQIRDARAVADFPMTLSQKAIDDLMGKHP